MDDTACRVGSNPTEASSLVPRRTQSYALHTHTHIYTHTHIHIHIHTRSKAGGYPRSGATRKRLRNDVYLKESSDRETTVHDYNTRERHTIATRLACKRWILGTTPWSTRVRDKCWCNADSLSPSIVSISRVPQALKGFLKRFPLGIDSLLYACVSPSGRTIYGEYGYGSFYSMRIHVV